jgi:hypothetical protein
VVRGFFLYGAGRAVPPATRLPVAPVLERAERRPISAEAFRHIANWADAAPSSYVRDLRMAGAARPPAGHRVRVPFDPAVDLGRFPR